MAIPAISNELPKLDRVSITAGHVNTATNAIKPTMSTAVSFTSGIFPAEDRFGFIIDITRATGWAR